MENNFHQGDFTLPGEAGYEQLTLELAKKWGADVIRDSDGTKLSDEIVQAGYGIYSTICIIRQHNAFANAHPDAQQQTFLCSDPVVATGDSVTIHPLEGFFDEQFQLNDSPDALPFWQVYDRTVDQEVPKENWKYENGAVTVTNVQPWHRYTVSFLAWRIWEEINMYNHTTNHWTSEHLRQLDPRHPLAWEYLQKWLRDWCQQNPDTTVVRFTSLFYNFVWIFGSDMRRRNPQLGMVEFWHRLRKRGYTRCPESLFRVMRKMGMFPPAEKKKVYVPKPYEQMQYPGQRVQVDVKVVPRKCITDPELRLYQYTAIDEFTRLRFLAAYPEQSTYSSADFLQKLCKWYARRGIRVECVQTDNGFEFTNRFSPSKKHLQTLFEATAAQLGIRHKLIRPYTPRHNGKVERSHREDQKRFYNCHAFFSLEDFDKQLQIHNRRSNNIPMRPLHWLSPFEFAVQYV